MLGDGTGHFTRGASRPFTAQRGMAAGDYNQDGHADVAVIDQSSSGTILRVFIGRGDGTFTERDRPVAADEYLIGAGDIDGDGALDLVVWNATTQQIGAWLGDGIGAFPTEHMAPSAGAAYRPRVADLNGDGLADVVAARYGTTLVAWLGRSDGTFSPPLFSDLPNYVYSITVADLTGDGRPDVLTSEGTLCVGNGDGTFGSNRKFNLSFTQAIAADIDRNGTTDLFIGTDYYTAMALYNLTAAPANGAPIARISQHELTYPFVDQFGEEGPSLDGTRSYDPNLDLISYSWTENGQVIGTTQFLGLNLAPGTHSITLMVRDSEGAESRDTASVTVTPYEEIVFHTAYTSATHGAWTSGSDSTAADGAMVWHPNANAAKLDAPLANPANYFEAGFPADPTQEYKLWIRLKAQGNSPFNDSVFVQFDGAVDASGAPIYQIGTTQALAVNLEECSGCGLSGWGWRDEAWGSKGAVGAVTLRFPAGSRGQMGHLIRIQTREDGVMIDQIVLSAVKYRTIRPGAIKNDATILLQTVPDE